MEPEVVYTYGWIDQLRKLLSQRDTSHELLVWVVEGVVDHTTFAEVLAALTEVANRRAAQRHISSQAARRYARLAAKLEKLSHRAALHGV